MMMIRLTILVLCDMKNICRNILVSKVLLNSRGVTCHQWPNKKFVKTELHRLNILNQ